MRPSGAGNLNTPVRLDLELLSMREPNYSSLVAAVVAAVVDFVVVADDAPLPRAAAPLPRVAAPLPGVGAHLPGAC